MKTFTQLNPELVWRYFDEILKVPRPSKKEEKIVQYLLDFATKNNLQATMDEVGNVLIKKPAFPGKEKVPTVVLQTHMDMVCEKNSDKEFDFENDPIEAIIGDEWVTANGTTLGADDGIGIAAQLALLSSENIKHGPIECLFTVDEETGLSGAFALKSGFFEGKILLNLDSEDEGEIFIGCAGGIDTIATFRYTKEQTPFGSVAFKIKVSGLTGGHSGDDIHKGLGNANKILARFLYQEFNSLQVALVDFDGGNLRNAIAREAVAWIVIPASHRDQFQIDFEQFEKAVMEEYLKTEPNLEMYITPTETPYQVMNHSTARNLLNALVACPHGVLEMSPRMPGMVETSTNLASVKFLPFNEIIVTTSQRSEIESRKLLAANMVEATFRLAGATVEHSDGYPGWTPNPDSEILKVAVESYRRLFDTEPIVRSIHAGLECGLFLQKYPGLDMISIGPTIKGAHSPSERINIETTEKFWKHLVDILETLT
ncbi:Xaa-His dipeptidase [Bacteroidales bacterium 6E]|nr:Xaa-His dipeptidase [Bacteroidales bacterium 6E]